MKKNVLLLSLLSLLGIVTSCYDDSELRERIEKLENTTIPSINEQISSIRSSITELQIVDNAIKNSITELQNADAGLRQNIADLQKADEGLGTEIENLKGIDAQHQRSIDLLTEQEDALSTQIANLQTYVDSSLVSQKEWAQNSLTNQAEWVSATFATLEQYASVVGNVATLQVTLDSLQAKLQADLQAMDEQNAALFAGVSVRIDSLARVLTQTESSLKTWVGEQFANYYDIAAVDARIAVINDSIVKGDERLATEVASVRTALAEAQKELTTAYQTAIRTAIEDYNGTITKQIASDIATVNGHIDDEVKRLDDRIDAVEKRVSELEGKVAELLKTLDITFDVEGSVAYSPGTTVNVNYTLTNADATTVVECLADAGWKATVKQTSSTQGSISVETPSAGGEGKVLVFANKGDRTVMKVLRFEQGILQVLTDVTALEPGDTLLTIDVRTNEDYKVVIPPEAQSWIELLGVYTRATMRTDVITLSVKANATNQSRSAVITIVDTQDKELSSFTIFQQADVQMNNEIWYTSTGDFDGSIQWEVTPYNPRAFGGLNIVRNTYVKGKGVILFDGDVITIGENAFGGEEWGCDNLESISLPQTVKTIGNGAFFGCRNLRDITIPNSIISIGNYAFSDCNLFSFSIPNTIDRIPDDCFHDCANLTSVNIPNSIKSVGSCAFANCYSLISVSIPNSVTSIGNSAFSGCSSLTSIIMPNSVTYIGSGAFSSCKSLTSVTIPNSVTSIGSSTFSNCSNLISVTIPEPIASINNRAFSGCSSLTSITIPSSVNTISDFSFELCYGLKSVICLGTIPPNANMAFPNDVANYCTLYVPTGCVDAYRTSEGWKNFKEIKEIE